jgi:NadR type nicotinamide-nucleotide adenylyltransferase
MIKKIVAIGPESTGKSMICEQLAKHYNTAWCPEYAREFLLKNGTRYTYDDLLAVAKGQLALEESIQSTVHSRQSEGSNQTLTAHSSHPTPYFIDTDMYVMKVWCEFVFGNCHRFILEQIVERKYDLYLLCNIDLEWIKDELREYPDYESRHKLYQIYKDSMINQSVPWVDISGNYEERLAKGIAAVNKIL